MGEAGGSSESEFSNERSSTNALRPRIDRGSAARLSWLRREDISRFMVWLLSVSSSSSLCSFLFWALEREFSSSTSSSCLFSCFSRTIDLSSCRRRAGRRKRRERTERSREVELTRDCRKRETKKKEQGQIFKWRD